MKCLSRCAAAVLFVFGVFLLPPPSSAASAESPVSVDSIVFARSVESRDPVGAAKEFEASVTQVFCWTKLSVKTLPAAVNHVWYNAGRKLLDVPLTLNYSSGRYWSAKNVSPGDWTVEVVGANGEVFGSGSFKVK
ncbi:MAG: DUF2914 domain-containing protein [Deltaproteobacteria bacterium]|nr:MAG: DUF2914 domain-containing protein [Deltaproteobacteria bacterium]